MTKLILASSSLGRKRLLDYLHLEYEIIHSNLDEDKIHGKTPIETIALRAKLKGEKVAESVNKNSIILSADSDAILENKVIGKPKNKFEAIKILKLFSGKTHLFVTSVQILKVHTNDSKHIEVIYSGETKSSVTFRTLTESEIDFYLGHTEYTRFAGSYALISAQDFITKVDGSLSNVIGLPLEVVIPILKQEFILK